VLLIVRAARMNSPILRSHSPGGAAPERLYIVFFVLNSDFPNNPPLMFVRCSQITFALGSSARKPSILFLATRGTSRTGLRGSHAADRVADCDRHHSSKCRFLAASRRMDADPISACSAWQPGLVISREGRLPRGSHYTPTGWLTSTGVLLAWSYRGARNNPTIFVRHSSSKAGESPRRGASSWVYPGNALAEAHAQPA